MDKQKSHKKGWIIFFSICFVLLVVGIIGLFKTEVLIEKIVHRNKEVIVPDLTGLKFDEAKAVLEKEQLLIEKDSEIFDPKIKPGRVVSQFPQQNSTVRQGRQIRVVVSKGGNAAEMPNVVGLEQREAESVLKNNGLIIGQEEFFYSSSVPAGQVISQSPEPLSNISRGKFANIKISKGLPPEGVKLMPSVIGLQKEVIEILLNGVGIKFNFEIVPTTDESKKGKAIEQSIASDEEITPEQTVNIKIGQ